MYPCTVAHIFCHGKQFGRAKHVVSSSGYDAGGNAFQLIKQAFLESSKLICWHVARQPPEEMKNKKSLRRPKETKVII